jgi:tRNA(adenine34) deaminase
MKTRSKDLEIIEDLLNLLTKTQQTFEVPVAAAIYDPEFNLISQSLNQREAANDPTAHAEIVTLRNAATSLGRWNLTGCTMYVTLEPCLMCAGAILESKISRLVFGAFDTKNPRKQRSPGTYASKAGYFTMVMAPFSSVLFGRTST